MLKAKAVSVLLPRSDEFGQMVNEVNRRIRSGISVYPTAHFIDNETIQQDVLYYDNVHLNRRGFRVLAHSFKRAIYGTSPRNKPATRTGPILHRDAVPHPHPSPFQPRDQRIPTAQASDFDQRVQMKSYADSVKKSHEPSTENTLSEILRLLITIEQLHMR